MLDLRKIVRPATQRRVREENAEVARLHALDDAGLARAVLELARRAREIRNDTFEIPQFTYTTAMTHQVIPFLAKKLDPTIELCDIELESIASTKSDRVNNMTRLAGDALRDHVGIYIDNASMTYGLTQEQRGQQVIRLLDRILEHGNPVALLVDRLAPAPDLKKVHRPGNAPPRYPAWSPTAGRPPLEGFWLMVTMPGGEEEVLDYLDDRKTAEEALARIAEEGLEDDHRLFRWTRDKLPELGTLVTFDLRNSENEVVSQVEAPLRREDPETEAVLEP